MSKWGILQTLTCMLYSEMKKCSSGADKVTYGWDLQPYVQTLINSGKYSGPSPCQYLHIWLSRDDLFSFSLQSFFLSLITTKIMLHLFTQWLTASILGAWLSWGICTCVPVSAFLQWQLKVVLQTDMLLEVRTLTYQQDWAIFWFFSQWDLLGARYSYCAVASHWRTWMKTPTCFTFTKMGIQIKRSKGALAQRGKQINLPNVF